MSPPKPLQDFLSQQNASFNEVVQKFTSQNGSYALLDFPDHPNIGDSAIYLGQVNFFDKAFGRSPNFVGTHQSDLSLLNRLCPEGPVFLTGGGNFGDIWKNHQDFRHRALSELKGRKIIQLPQSIFYRDPSVADMTAKLIREHGNFTLLVRDTQSYEFAEKNFECDLDLCPDAAMTLKFERDPDPSIDLLAMLREDQESTGKPSLEDIDKLICIEDWAKPKVWSMHDRAISKFVFAKLPHTQLSIRLMEQMFRRHAEIRVFAGIQQLSRAKIVATDRLHVHILSTLLQIPHFVLDNSYGKICRYIDTWGMHSMVKKVGSPENLKATIEGALKSGF